MDYDDLELLDPRRRRVLWWTAGGVLVLAVAAAGLHLYGRSRLDDLRRDQGRYGPSDLAAHAPSTAPEPQNAALAFLAAAEGVHSLADDLRPMHETRELPPEVWPADVRRAVERHLAANAEPLAALHRAAALPGGGLGLDYAQPFPLGTRSPWDLIPATRLLELDGHVRLAADDVEGTADVVVALGRLAELLHAEPEPTLQILAFGAASAQLSLLRELVAAGAPPGLRPRLERSLAGTADRAALARAVRRQNALLLGDDAGRIARAMGRSAGGLWHPAAWVAGELLLVEGLAGRAELARVDELPYPSLAAAVDSASTDLPLGPFEGIHVELQAAALKACAAAASRQLAELALALAATAAEDGRYPATLPDHRAATTPDPLTARLPSYRLAADGSARLALDAAAAKAGAEGVIGSLPFVWELPAPP